MKEKLIRFSNPFKWYNGDLKRYLIFQIWTMLRTIDDFIMSITFQIVITDFGYHFICGLILIKSWKNRKRRYKMLKIVSIDDNLYRISFERPKKKNGGANRVTICRVEKIEPAIENNPPVIDSCVAISFCNKTDLEKRGFNYDIGRRQALRFKALHNHFG